MLLLFFFFNDPATTEIYPLSPHDALPICATRRINASGLFPSHSSRSVSAPTGMSVTRIPLAPASAALVDRKSTRLNSSHSQISYAVFCLKKKKRHHSHHLCYGIIRRIVTT